jgi:hypothetical protein
MIDEHSLFLSLKGVFLALLIFSASFLAPYVGCNFQSKLKNATFFKYFLLFLVIYFSINLVDPQNESKENPIYPLLKSTFVFIVFTLLNALSSTSLYLVLILFALLILTNNYYYYYHAIVVDKKKYKYVEDLIVATEYGLTFSIFIILIVSLFLSKERISLKQCNL